MGRLSGPDRRVIGFDIIPGSNTHTPGDEKHVEHDAILEFTRLSEVTHYTVKGGNWNTPSIWSTGTVPGAGAKVLIRKPHTVRYNISSAVSVAWIRVHGCFFFARQTNTDLVVDTIFVDSDGTLDLGTETDPITANCNIKIDDSTDIVFADDPRLVSRGIIVHGTWTAHGNGKTPWDYVASNPLATATSATLGLAPANWQAGDRIIIPGTIFGNRADVNQDEIRSIDSVTDATVNWTGGLTYDHKSLHPTRNNVDHLNIVANFTRNIKISSLTLFDQYTQEAFDGTPTLPIHRRGHCMMMHSAKCDIRYIQFHELGRTRKDIDIILDVEAGAEPAATTDNIRGRYPFHFHRPGVVGNPSIVIGCSVWGSPGWGITQHDSFANILDCVSFNCFGAHFVAEVGNERGVWGRNVAIYSKGGHGVNTKNAGSVANFDLARVGIGHYFQGRNLPAFECIAASCCEGFTFFHRHPTPDPMIPIDGRNGYELPDALAHREAVTAIDVPIIHFADNEAFGCVYNGLFIEKQDPRQGHDFYTHLKRFKAWNMSRTGAHIAYTAHYVMDGFDLYGIEEQLPGGLNVSGITIGSNANDQLITNLKVEGFDTGIKFDYSWVSDPDVSANQENFYAIDPDISNCTFDYNSDNIKHTSTSDPTVNDDSAGTAGNGTFTGGDWWLNSTTGVKWMNDGNPPGQPTGAAIWRATNIPGTKVTAAQLTPGRMNITLNGPLTYDRAGSRTIAISGTKQDSLPIDTAIPPGGGQFDGYNLTVSHTNALLETLGYRTIGATPYLMLPLYFGDRATGVNHKFGFKVELQNMGGDLALFTDNGALDEGAAAPSASDVNTTCAKNGEVEITLAAAKSAPGTAGLDEFVQPDKGVAIDLGNGKVTYKPHYNFVGTDTFRFYVWNGHTKYAMAVATIEVGS